MSGRSRKIQLAPDVRKGMKVKLSKVYKSCSDAQSLGAKVGRRMESEKEIDRGE